MRIPAFPATWREAVLPTSQRHSMSSVPKVVKAQWHAARTALVAAPRLRARGVGPVADLGGSRLVQAQADPAEPGAGGGVFGEEFGPLPAVPAGQGHLVDEERGVLHLIRQGHLDEVLHRRVL
jgi:hypothetical protein